MTNDPVLDDQFIELEETNDETLAWIGDRNDVATETLSGEVYDRVKKDVFDILSSTDKLETGTKRGEWVYSFWTDGTNPRGLWRRTSFEKFMTTPEWDTILDVDALGKAEGESWVFHGASLLRPDYRKALVSLSPGGSDAHVTREFDVETREFVDGFATPHASKGTVAWIDDDTVLAAWEIGENSMTESGYPRTVRLWERGTELADAPIIFEGEYEDISVGGYRDFTPGFEKTIIYRSPSFREAMLYDYSDGELTEIKIPYSANVGTVRDWAIVELRYDWEVGSTTYPAGSLLALPYADALSGPVEDNIHVLFTPTSTSSLLSATELHSGLAITIMDNVKTKIFYAAEGDWKPVEVESDHEFDTVGLSAVDSTESDDVWMIQSGFLTPTTLRHGTISADGLDVTTLRSEPARFDTEGLSVDQKWATSLDGTKVPYFVVGPTEIISGHKDGRVLLDGYGGFEVPRLPAYLAPYGKAWLEQGNVYALANIRGGGEFGPAWHQAALKENRNKAYEDFASVAKDLVDSGLTTVDKLAATGGSNGGLLIGNMYTRYFQYFGALICRVPLLDMKRYNKLLAGASWMGEYGNPDTEDWAFMQQYSAYHNVRESDDHPPILITTSTKDDRVHPGHARKFAALLESYGKDVTYFENTEGGHAGAADAEQQSLMMALIFTFLDMKLSK